MSRVYPLLTISVYHTGYPLGDNTTAKSSAAGRNPLLRVFVGRHVMIGDRNDDGLLPHGVARRFAKTGSGGRGFLG